MRRRNLPSLRRKWSIFIFEDGILEFLQELEQRLREEVAAKEGAERNMLKMAKEMIAGENRVNLSLFDFIVNSSPLYFRG